MTRTDRIVCLLLVVAFSSLYFATTSGVTCSNDGSHYALTRAIAEEGRFTIASYDDYAEGNDVARRDGQLYSDRPPGTALLASAFYKLGGILPRPSEPVPSRHDAQNPRLLYVMLVPVLAGAATLGLVYLISRSLGVSISGALTAVVALGLGTVHWKYSSVLFSHALSGFLVVLAVYLALQVARQAQGSWPVVAVLGFVVGCAVLVEYSNAVVVAAVAVFLWAAKKPRTAEAKARRIGLYVLGGLVPAAFLAFYNTVNFGTPFSLSYDYAINYPWAGNLSETFSFPIGRGLIALLFWGEGGGWCNPTCYNQGLFLLSPVLLLSAFGLVPFVRRARRLASLTLGLFFVFVLLFAMHRTFHGFTADSRYLTPFLTLWSLPLAFFAERLDRDDRSRPWTTLLRLLFYGFLFLSARNVFLHIGSSYNYALDLSSLSGLVVSPANWAHLLREGFPNAENLPLLWLFEGLVALVSAPAWWTSIHRHRTE
jgi:hypothetical protein